MKTITRKLISTRREDYGQLLAEVSYEVDDDYEERVDWKPAGYFN